MRCMCAVGDWRRPWWFKAKCGVRNACLHAPARQPYQPAATTREDKGALSPPCLPFVYENCRALQHLLKMYFITLQLHSPLE